MFGWEGENVGEGEGVVSSSAFLLPLRSPLPLPLPPSPLLSTTTQSTPRSIPRARSTSDPSKHNNNTMGLGSMSDQGCHFEPALCRDPPSTCLPGSEKPRLTRSARCCACPHAFKRRAIKARRPEMYREGVCERERGETLCKRESVCERVRERLCYRERGVRLHAFPSNFPSPWLFSGAGEASGRSGLAIM